MNVADGMDPERPDTGFPAAVAGGNQRSNRLIVSCVVIREETSSNCAHSRPLLSVCPSLRLVMQPVTDWQCRLVDHYLLTS